MKLIDLTVTIETDMPVYPGDAGVEVKQIRFLEQHHFNNFSITMTAHSGTHLDGPMHMTTSDLLVGDINLEKLVGRGKIIRTTGERILLDTQFEAIEAQDIVLFQTGSEKIYGTREYYEEHPVLSEEVVDYLIEKGVKVIGIDAPSIERDPYNLHPKWFHAGGLIVENLRNLEEVSALREFEVFIIPLKVKADSSPARVFVKPINS